MTAATEFPDFLSWLGSIRACAEGVRWAQRCESILEAGEACPSSEWLLWTVKESGFSDAEAGRRFAVACVHRVRSLLADPRQHQAAALLEAVAAGSAPERDLATAAHWASQARAELAMSTRWSMAAGAAATALWHATHEDAWGAATEVRRHCLRAVAWDPWDPATAEDADGELAVYLRAVLRPHAGRIVSAIRMRLAEKTLDAQAGPCGGC